MDFNIEIRKKQLDNLDQLISSSRSRIQSVLSYLDWTQENVEKGDPLVQCPVNPHHRIHPKSWTEHIEKCVVQIEGYSSNSQFLSESLDNPTQSIYIDRNKKIELITKELAEKGALRLAWNGLDPDPRTSDRLISTFSPDERLIFYNYTVQNTEGPPSPPEFTTLYDKKHDEEKPLTYEEILAQERDSKRRRAKYKSVHINRKNHTEVIREVINGQMGEYKEWLLAKDQTKDNKECNNGVHDDKKEEIERPHSSTSRNSSSSRSTNRKYDRHRDERDRSRKRYVRSRSRERSYRSEDRNCEERRNRRNRSGERRRSRERDRRHSRDRSRRSFSDVRRR
ncbi:U11/U12 small nuclear ribonucleoprotein 48 kDa protein [Tribolium castaneum]|uniref:U11/U12 small nuclear ribonucleoprotein 48 kDa protein-like Protein n=1 Tax=Tribolium castaneum TaxID=7070 RepID=D6WAB4_TRICA|nr:PREDICTED: U11/U12 small nuclear ribonucleoprotein 48 kDa protein [Tribolium castaneum]EEZ98612.2 U11/U12 small nuclear ribonucleoprotein 48 kDa protein-like Protein [Tribolium castaneum]|eukprot:XP_008201563.1 PREDICTED: U11/U12 small nuclear ribonucleoprotein 48 kDa protein [Tribolium castaneum]